MNYYEHHIRDYDAATSHLSWDEDLAYTRLIRWYYRKEKPVPSDIKEACRQVRATSKIQRDAVESVLREFFELREDGWHNETCDDVITRFKDGAPEREAKRANEENRTKRHRDERSRLFKTLTDAGGHAPWNIKIEELRELVKNVSCDKPATAPVTPVTPPVTAPVTPVTATQSPITNHQSPEYYSVPIGTGGEPPNEPPLDPKDQVYAIGIALLTSAEVTEKNARSFLAMQVKAHTAPVVVDALQRCAEEKPIQPVPWLVSALKSKAKRNSKHTGFDQLDYTEGINADGSFA